MAAAPNAAGQVSAVQEAGASWHRPVPLRVARLVALRWLFLVMALFYLWTAGSNFSSGDAYAELAVAQNLVEHGWVNVQPLHAGVSHDGSAVLGSDGRYYASHGLGYSLLLLPFYLVARVVATESHLPHCQALRDCVAYHLISWSSCLIAALTVAAVARLCLDLGYSLRRAFLVALLFALASPSWPYARFGFDITPTALALLWAVREALLAERLGRDQLQFDQALRRWLSAGSMGALAILIRLPSVAALLPLAIFVVAAQRGQPRRRAVSAMAACVAPLLLACAFTGWYNAVRFGSVLDDGHSGNPAEALVTAPWTGLAGMLVSPGKGLLWYCPILVLAILAVKACYRRQPTATILALGTAICSLLPYSIVRDWYGGWAWGPRFTLAALPLVLLPLVALPEALKGAASRRLAGALVVAGVLVQAAGTLVNYHDRLSLAQQRGVLDRIVWDPRYAPIGDHLATLFTYALHPGDVLLPSSLAQSYDLWWLNLWRNDGVPQLPVLAAGLLVLLLTMMAAWRCAQAYRAAVGLEEHVR